MPQHDACRNAGIRQLSDDGDAESSSAHQIDGARSGDAYQIWHDVPVALLPAVDEQRDRGALRGPRWFLRDDRPARILAR